MPSEDIPRDDIEIAKTRKPIEPNIDNISSDDGCDGRGQRNRAANKKNIAERVNNKEYQEDNDLALSDLEENQRKELLDLEM